MMHDFLNNLKFIENVYILYEENLLENHNSFFIIISIFVNGNCLMIGLNMIRCCCCYPMIFSCLDVNVHGLMRILCFLPGLLLFMKVFLSSFLVSRIRLLRCLRRLLISRFFCKSMCKTTMLKIFISLDSNQYHIPYLIIIKFVCYVMIEY